MQITFEANISTSSYEEIIIKIDGTLKRVLLSGIILTNGMYVPWESIRGPITNRRLNRKITLD